MKNRNFKKMFAWIIVLIFLLGTFPATTFAASEVADSIYLNGNIYTMDEDQPNASAIAVKGQKILYVGTDDGAKAYV